MQAVMTGAVGASFRLRGSAQAPPPPVVATKLAPDLVWLSGAGGNVALVIGSDGVFMIDSGFPERSADLLKAVSDVDTHKVTTLLNTHWHFDHVGSNEALGRMGAKIVAHENTKAHLSVRTPMEVAGRTFDPLKPEGIPVETFTSGGRVTFAKQRLEYTHVPLAHTDGDAYVFFPALNVLHTGDLLFNGTFPVIDYSNGGWIGGMAQAAAALAKVGDANTRIIPGHGPLATKDDLKATYTMLATIQERIEPMIKAGKSIEEAVAAHPTREFDEKYGQGVRKPDAFVQVAYTSIMRHAKK